MAAILTAWPRTADYYMPTNGDMWAYEDSCGITRGTLTGPGPERFAARKLHLPALLSFILPRWEMKALTIRLDRDGDPDESPRRPRKKKPKTS